MQPPPEQPLVQPPDVEHEQLVPVGQSFAPAAPLDPDAPDVPPPEAPDAPAEDTPAAPDAPAPA
jgi:hypothetical protein